MRCDACGFELALRSKFCSECGEPVPRIEPVVSSRPSTVESSPSAPLGERRQITVLFCDLVGSTAMASRLDPEDWREVVSEYQEASTAAVERHDGYVAQYLGDGLVVYFGFPTAHEDDALRATRAGLSIIDALAEIEPGLERRHGVKLSARIGLHTGTVVVGEMGPSSRREPLALGDATNLTARLQELAAPGTVVMSDATFRLVRRHFVTEELGVHALKGITKPVAVHRAIGPSRSRRTSGSGQDLATPMVGRGQELRLLMDRWGLATEGHGQTVILSGEAGIGKSRVMLALRQRLANEPHVWLECRASSYMEDTALHPVVALQEDAFLFGAFDEPEQKAAHLERALENVGLSPAEHLSLFANLHALPLPQRYAPLVESPEAQRKQTLESLVEWFLRKSATVPVVALFEDLHWVDPTTLALLSRLTERVADARILLLLTHRPTFQPPWPSGSHVTPMLLSRLTRQDSVELVENVEAPRGHLADALVGEIVSRSDGIPLFLEELTKAVLETDAGRLRDDDGARASLVPSSLQDSLMARLDQLGPAKELAQHCATLGREFSLEILRASAPIDDSALTTALDRLVAAELFQRRGDPPVYSFRHALVQEQAYESLLKTTRQAHHRRIAEVLVSQFPQIATTQPELVAHHYDEGGMAETALGFWLQAGQRSIARSANVEASRQLRRGLDALARLRETQERDQQELFLLTMRGITLLAVRGYAAAEVEQAFARARALCHKQGDTPHLFPVLFGLFLYYMVRSDADPARGLVEQLELAARKIGDPEYLLEAHTARAALSYWEGRFTDSQEHILHARLLYDPVKHVHHRFVYGQDPLAYGYCYGALILWFQGYPDQALESAEKALALADNTNHPHTYAGILSFAADLYYHRKDTAGFLSLAEWLLAVSERQVLPLWEAAAKTMIGSAKCFAGDPSQGIPEIETGLREYRATGAGTNTSYLLARLADACLLAGRTDAGLGHVNEALRLSETQLDRYYSAELHRLRGELLRGVPEPDYGEIEACFGRALAVAKSQQAKSLELRAAMSLGNLWCTLGKRDEARELVSAVYAWFTEGFATKDLSDAREFLASVT